MAVGKLSAMELVKNAEGGIVFTAEPDFRPFIIEDTSGNELRRYQMGAPKTDDVEALRDQYDRFHRGDGSCKSDMLALLGLFFGKAGAEKFVEDESMQTCIDVMNSLTVFMSTLGAVEATP